MNPNNHYTYHIVPRNESAGGGWTLRLMENHIKVGGGAFPVTVDMTSAAAHLEAFNAGESWLWSHMQSAVDIDQVAASLWSAHQGDEVALAAAMLMDQSFEIDQLRAATAPPALQALVAQLRRTLCSIQESPRLADVRSLASLGVARIDAVATGQQPRDHWISPDNLPDADVVVLLALTDGNVWPGYRDADEWRATEGFVIDASRIVAWMHMPAGPTSSPVQTSAPEKNAMDAARWRESLMHVGGEIRGGRPRFTLGYLGPLRGARIMEGSIAEHFTDAIDHAAIRRLQRAPETPQGNSVIFHENPLPAE